MRDGETVRQTIERVAKEDYPLAYLALMGIDPDSGAAKDHIVTAVMAKVSGDGPVDISLDEVRRIVAEARKDKADGS